MQSIPAKHTRTHRKTYFILTMINVINIKRFEKNQHFCVPPSFVLMPLRKKRPIK